MSFSLNSSKIDFLKIKIDEAFQDQKPGTSGLRKSTKQFLSNNYLQSFVEAIFKTLPGVNGGILILGGDGRFGNKKAIEVIIAMAVAHGISRIITTVDGILSTPAASNLIRKHKAIGGIILSASHNPGGQDGDFGVKVNGPNGGPASESLTNEIYSYTKHIDSYQTINLDALDISIPSEILIGKTVVEVVDGIEDYVALMQEIFDFEKISCFIKNNFPIAFDALNAVTGPYAKKILEDLLGASAGTVRNGIPLEDFGGCHPDPNLTYAKDLADLLLKSDKYSFGAACDGDGDRNMILGNQCFVNPSDSLAVLTANANCVPAYAKGLFGVARSMPTSSAVDVVAKELGINCYETPTGWKFFGNLLDSEKITLCGEESFGTGSNHVREKDGLWAVLFWLQILAEKQCSVSDLMKEHWSKYGRHYYSRHDYEEVDLEIANNLYTNLEARLPSLINQNFAGIKVCIADNFKYQDPIDHSLTDAQGLRIILEDGSRVVLRLSGTGTKGATLRVYLENYVSPDGDLAQDPQRALSALITAIDQLAEITKRTGMDKPTVIT